MRFQYQCPDCLSTNNLHERGCAYKDLDRTDYEKAYIDIISVLSELTCSKSSLITNAHQWSDLHEDVLARLETIGHVEQDNNDYYTLVPPGARGGESEPYIEPLATIYQYGTVPGCHDDGLFALLAFYSHIELSWEETKEEILDWYERTGAWERGGFEEEAPEALLEKKKRIWETGYGWEQKGRQAKQVIERSRSSQSSTPSSSHNTETPA